MILYQNSDGKLTQARKSDGKVALSNIEELLVYLITDIKSKSIVRIIPIMVATVGGGTINPVDGLKRPSMNSGRIFESLLKDQKRIFIMTCEEYGKCLFGYFHCENDDWRTALDGACSSLRKMGSVCSKLKKVPFSSVGVSASIQDQLIASILGTPPLTEFPIPVWGGLDRKIFLAFELAIEKIGRMFRGPEDKLDLELASCFTLDHGKKLQGKSYNSISSMSPTELNDTLNSIVRYKGIFNF